MTSYKTTEQIIKEKNLEQINDEGALKGLVEKIIKDAIIKRNWISN